MIVTLRQTSRDSWSGVRRYKNCSVYLAPYLTRSGGKYTGLALEDEERLGEALRQDLSPNSEFWTNFFIRVTDDDVILDTASPEGELKYLFLKNHKRVANGLSDKTKPGANYVLINDDEQAKEANKRNQTKRKAFREFDKMSMVDMRKCLRIYGHASDTMSNELVEHKLGELIEENPQKFFEKWVDNKLRVTEFQIKDAVSRNVIRKNRNLYQYGTEIIGRSLEEAVAFLDDPQNQDIKMAIIKETGVK
jgi:hypothetical protein